MEENDLDKLKIRRDPLAKRGRRSRLTPWLALIIGLVIATGWVIRGWIAPTAVDAATVSTAYPSQSYTLLNAAGYVVAQRKAAVASKATGRLEWLGVQEGSLVKRNEVIARLEDRDVTATMEQAAANIKVAQANLMQAQSELTEAERNLARSSELVAKNFVSQAAHDTAQFRYEKARALISGYQAAIAVAQANFRASQVAVDQTLIRAPFEGVVLTKNASVGDVITPFSSALGAQAAVVTMADMSTLEVEADVSESNLGKLQPGQPCEIQLDAFPQQRYSGRLRQLVPTIDRAKATVVAKVRFDQLDPRILPEMSAKVAFLTQEIAQSDRSARVVAPATALIQSNGRNVVFVINGDTAVESSVDVGDKIGELVEIRSGLKAGDKVVLRPAQKLRHGARVSVNK